MMRRFSALVSAVIILAGCVSGGGAALPSVLTEQAFSPPDWEQTLYADIHLPEGRGPHAAVIVVHGGGWARRSRDDMDGIARELAQAGYVAMNIDYRFAPEHVFPAQLHDLQIAVRWLRQHATDLDVDADRVAVLGYSSGGHLASLLGLVAGQGGVLDQPYGGEDTRIQAVVAGGAPMDLRKYSGGRLVPAFLGGTRDEVPEVFAAASPVTHVHRDAPPFFLFHARQDRTVSLDHATDFQVALEAAGGDVVLYEQAWRGHITGFLWRGDATAAALSWLEDTLAAL
ncbi:alpha/beta hydrolase [Isoalcanivorax indicus]|uniref:alpha/beta hydrolase n=1 Tax=Isoalcanivorax indicus TaxID=2202653 RepID=UPI000DB91562|nr:alpha/beta hydrolase [Isoalcanivorax indicus]